MFCSLGVVYRRSRLAMLMNRTLFDNCKTTSTGTKGAIYAVENLSFSDKMMLAQTKCLTLTEEMHHS
jgi:hypothetical protein